VKRVDGDPVLSLSQALYVPGCLAFVACVWHLASAPVSPPRFAWYAVDVTKTLLVFIPHVPPGRQT
jgi:hypothetical protein